MVVGCCLSKFFVQRIPCTSKPTSSQKHRSDPFCTNSALSNIVERFYEGLRKFQPSEFPTPGKNPGKPLVYPGKQWVFLVFCLENSGFPGYLQGKHLVFLVFCLEFFSVNQTPRHAATWPSPGRSPASPMWTPR